MVFMCARVMLIGAMYRVVQKQPASFVITGTLGSEFAVKC